MNPSPDITGMKFGRLLVIVKDGKKRGRAAWKCKCDCGNEISVDRYSLISGNTKSCGCLQKELAKARMTKHGLKWAKVYETWENMKYRCLNSNYKQFSDYGGRGIKVCDRWIKFENFFKDMGHQPEGMTIERIDNDGNYEPSNCKWASRMEQAENKRGTVLIEIDGKTMTASAWAREKGINPRTFHARIHQLGWDIKKALTEPPRKLRRKSNKEQPK